MRPDEGEGGGEITEDRLLGGRVTLRQPRRGHRAGTDAVLLAASVGSEVEGTLTDVGAATGAVALMVGARAPGARLLLIERDGALAELARGNLTANGLAHRAEVLAADLLELPPGTASADVVATNPPYLDPAVSRPSPQAGRAAAHVMPEGGLRAWLAACARLLRPRGALHLIHRADALAACLAALPGDLGGVSLRFVHPRADAPATRVLLVARRGSRAPLEVRPPLVLHEAEGGFTPLARALHAGEAWLE